MGYAFISYSSINQESADAMREMFNKHNIHTWMAPYDIPAGSSYMGEINRALLGCDCLVLMLSEAAQNSQWVLKELERAVSYKKTIIPIKIEDIVLNDDFDFVLGSCHVVAVRKIDENSDEVKNVLNSVIACTREKNKDVGKTIDTETVKVKTDSIVETKNNESGVALNKSQRKELMSCKCGYCGMHAEMLLDNEGYYAQCVHCGAVGTIADTIDAAITNWKLCMIDDNENSETKPRKDDVSFIESKSSKISTCFDDTINSIDSILDEIQSVLDSNDEDMTDSECLLEETELKQEYSGSIGYLALSLDDVLITKNCKQQFSNPITLRMPNNESLEFEFVEKSNLDEKYIIVSRCKSKDSFVFSVFKNPEGTANPPTAIFEGKKLKKIYRAFMEKHKNEYEFTDEIAMKPNIQPRKSEQPRVFAEKTAQGMFGPYLKEVIEIPCKYTLIDSHVFNYASTSYLPKNISKLIIPDSVTKIEAFAFSDIIVNEIEVSDNVTEIGVGAFNLSADGFIVCTPNSYAYKYAKYHDLKNSVDISNDYKIKGVCAYCGGKFSGVFKKKCSLCGKEKDY